MNNLVITSLLILASCSVFAFEQDIHDHKEEKEINEHAEKVVELTPLQMKRANITIAEIHATSLAKPLYSPGEVKANGYTSYYVSPRVESVVLKRHAMLGQQVVKGEPLVTLFSESVAQAQADYKVAYSDWQRLKNLTSSTVSEKEKLVSQTAYFAAQGRLKAYGLNEQDIKGLELLSNNNLGEYILYAERGGAVGALADLREERHAAHAQPLRQRRRRAAGGQRGPGADALDEHRARGARPQEYTIRKRCSGWGTGGIQ